MATIKEIAELAGVSRGTVDRVLNHRGSVNADTERKVLEIAELLNYQPNKAGMALAAQKKKYIIGVLLVNEENPFFDEVIEGLMAKLDELSIYGCKVIIKRVPFTPAAQLTALAELHETGIHGLILAPYNAAELEQAVNELSVKGIPCVTVHTDLPNSRRIAHVGSDSLKSGRIAANLLQLVGSGIIRAGIITGSSNVSYHEERVLGFTDYIKSNRLPVQIVDICENGDDDYKCYGAVSTMLSEHPEINVLYFTGTAIYGGYRAIDDAGLSRPPIIITFDAVPSTKELLKQGIITATICQRPKEQGSHSLSLLIDYLLTNHLPAEPLVHMDLEIKIKESL